MNSRERILPATRHRQSDRIPVGIGTQEIRKSNVVDVIQIFMKIQILLLLILTLFLGSCKKDERTFNGNVYIINKVEFNEFVKNNFLEVDGNLFIDVADGKPDDENISSLYDLTSLNRINGSITVSGTLISSMEGLENISGFNGDITVKSNKNLKNLDGIEHIVNQAKNIEIKNNPQLEDINSLSVLTSVPGNLTITGCYNISSISALANLEKVEGNLILSDLYLINNLEGLSSISTVNGDFEIANYKNLNDVSGLSKLTLVGGTIKLSANYKLTNLNGLSGIKSSGGIVLEYMSELTDTNGLSVLNNVNGDVILSWNDKLNNVDGFNGITEIGGMLLLNQNRSLTDLDGLKNLQTVGELYFNVLRAPNLDAFQNLLQINGDVTIICGDATDYCGLRNALQNFSNNFVIRGGCGSGFNPTLEEILDGKCAL